MITSRLRSLRPDGLPHYIGIPNPEGSKNSADL